MEEERYFCCNCGEEIDFEEEICWECELEEERFEEEQDE